MTLSIVIDPVSFDMGEKREAIHKKIKNRMKYTDCEEEDVRLCLVYVRNHPPECLKMPYDKKILDREINRWYHMDRDFMKIMLGVKK